MLFSGGFIVAGVSVASLMIDEEGLGGVLMGGLLALVGSTIFGYGLWTLLRTTR